MTTWLRGARCTDPEAMPEMEARPPAENRHGGAPRGERPASWDAPRLTRADRRVSQTRQQNKCACRRSAHPSFGDGRERKRRTRAQQRAAGTNNTALFDIVNTDGQRFASRAATSHASCAPSRVPGERASASEDPGPRGDTTDRARQTILRCATYGAGSRLSFRSARCIGRDTRSAPDFVHARRRPFW